MDLFYTIVIGIAILVLIIILAVIGVQMSSKTANKVTFPPTQGTCPDYWSIADDNKSCQIPLITTSQPLSSLKNVGKVYDANGKLLLTPQNTFGFDPSKKTIDFTNKSWTSLGSTNTCQERTWANNYNILWDGVSNYNKC
jgi:hypothetical protein